MTAVQQRLVRLFEHADKVYKNEEIDARIENLSLLYESSKPGVTEGSVVHVNKVYPRVRTAMSSLFGKRPEIIVRPRRAEDIRAASDAEVLLNYMTRALKLSRELRDWLFWARLGMYGAMKLGMTTWHDLKMPTFFAHDPRSVRVDVTQGRFRPEEGAWQAFRYQKSVAELRASGLYREEAINEIMDTRPGSHEESTEETTEVMIWEQYIRERVEGRKAILVVTSVHQVQTQTLSPDSWKWIREEPFTDVAGLPGRFLAFIPSTRKVLPVSPIELWMSQQTEINAFRTQKLLHAERSNRKRIYDATAFIPEESAKFEDPNPDLYIAATPTRQASLRDAIIEEPMTTVSPDVYTGELEADNTITEIDGIGSAQLSSELPKRGSTSATRDAIMDHALRLRMSDNQEIFDEALEDAYQGLLNLAQVHMDGALVVKLLGQDQRRISKAEIKGDLDVILSFGSTTARDAEREWQEARELFELFRGDPDINQVRLKRYVLQKRKDIKDADQWIVPAMPAMPPPVPGLPGVPGAGPALPMNGAGLGTPQAVGQELAGTQQVEGTSPLSIAAAIRGML